MSKTILLTGDRGFIASFLRPVLLQEGWKLRGLDNDADKPSFNECDSMLGDVRDPYTVERAVEGVSAVFHFAAAHHDFGIPVEEYHDVNVNGTRCLIDACRGKKIDLFIFFSSVAVYGHGNGPDEKSPTTPTTPYGESKLEAEKLVQEWVAEKKTRRAIVIRPTVVFGPRNTANMYSLIRQVISGRFFLVGDGRNIKSVAYVENLVAATLFLLERMEPGVKIYNYTDQPDMTTREIVETIARHAEVRVPRTKIPKTPALLAGAALDKVAHWTGVNIPITSARIRKFCTQTRFNSNRIREEGFRQPVSLDEGFRRTVEWVMKQKN